MTRNGNHKESISSAPDQEDGKAPGVGRWARLRDFVLSRSKGKKARYPEDRQIDESATNQNTTRSSRAKEPTSLFRQRTVMDGNKSGFGGSSRSLRNMTKTKTFSTIFGTRKGRTNGDEIFDEPQDELTSEHSQLEGQDSSNISNQQNSPEEEPLKADRLRWVRESNANRTMIFNGDLPPSSPLSTKPLNSGETEMSGKSRQSDASVAEGERLKRSSTNDQASASKEEQKVKDTETKTETTTSRSGSKTLKLRKTLLNMRLGSIAIDDARLSSRLMSSPLASPRRVQRRSSSLPDYLCPTFERSTSAPGESRTGTKKQISNDYDSPWGVKDTGETDAEGDNRNSSKSFRVTDFVQGLKARKNGQSSSDNLSLTDDDESQEADGTAEPVDMFEDDFVDYSIRHIHKSQGYKTIRGRTKKGLQTFSQMH